VLGESNADDRIESMLSLVLRFGERERNEEIDFVGLEGREASAFGSEGIVFWWIRVRS
jgi:hypothetical protein